jgi:hypothetical protein
MNALLPQPKINISYIVLNLGAKVKFYGAYFSQY